MAATTRARRKSDKETNGVKKIRKPKYIKEVVPVKLGNRGKFPCRFCSRVFSTEKIVLRHMCEQRRRFNQKDTVYSRYGFHAYLEMQQVFHGKDHGKTEEDFRKSDYYLACLRWGRFVINVSCWNPNSYLSWLLRLSVSIDKWNNDEIYDCYLQHYMLIEDPWDATNRSIENMVKWSDETNETFGNYFRKAGGGRILTDVRRGLISGWCVFCSDSGKEWLNSLAQGDLDLVWPWIDAARFKHLFNQKPYEVEEITKICQISGL